jgi:hypothetical protein
LADSRKGIYEHVGMDGPHVRLRELVTNADFTCHPTSGYRGNSGGKQMALDRVESAGNDVKLPRG